MIDVHCHITAEEFSEDREAVLEVAKNVGVKAIIAVSEYPCDFQRVIDLSKRYPDLVFPCIGVHPVQLFQQRLDAIVGLRYLCGPMFVMKAGSKSVTMKEWDEAEPFIKKHTKDIVGIGEVGLDFTPYHIKSPKDKDVQREVFKKQIRLAKELDLPLNVHSRSAGRPVIETLIQEDVRNVVLHAFDGKPSVAMRGVDAGYFFSVPPSIVRSEQKQRLVKQIPLSNLLLETDAPALGPEKQERNLPMNIRMSSAEIARIKNVSLSQVDAETTRNALKLFPKLPK